MFHGVASVRFQVGGRSMLIEFLVAKQLSVHAILGTSFIDENVEAIFPREHCIVLRDIWKFKLARILLISPP
jgi:hypothetical protein